MFLLLLSTYFNKLFLIQKTYKNFDVAGLGPASLGNRLGALSHTLSFERSGLLARAPSRFPGGAGSSPATLNYFYTFSK